MRCIDLSSLIANSPKEVPPFLRTDIRYESHAEGAKQAGALLKVPPSAFRSEEGWATETITQLNTHATTHVDAPWHYNSVIQGKPAPTIDQLPLEWFFGDGVVLDMTHRKDGEVIDIAEIERALAHLDYALKPLDIVLMRTGRDAFYDQPDYPFKGCGVSAKATHWLYERGIRVMGIDAWGWDAPLNLQAAEWNADHKPGKFWGAHQVDLPYAHIERLVNLGALPSLGFKISCFPLKIHQGSAGPARVVAILP